MKYFFIITSLWQKYWFRLVVAFPLKVQTFSGCFTCQSTSKSTRITNQKCYSLGQKFMTRLEAAPVKVLICNLQHFCCGIVHEMISFHLPNASVSESCISRVAKIVQNNVDCLCYIFRSQNSLDWKGPTRIKWSSWKWAAHTEIEPRTLRLLAPWSDQRTIWKEIIKPVQLEREAYLLGLVSE